MCAAFGDDNEMFGEFPRTFLNAATQDLKVPLVLIQGLAAELEQDGFKTRQARDQALRRILLSTQRMINVVDSISTIHNVAHNQATLHLSPVSLPHILRQVQTDLTPLALEYDHSIKMHYSSALPTAYAHSTAIYRVLFAVLDNIIKHTATPSVIQLNARLSRQSIVLRIDDPSATIKPNEFYSITSHYGERGDPAQKRTNNSGLDLLLANELMQAMNGSMHVRLSRGVSQIRLRFARIEQLNLFEKRI